jgi:nicotinate-nucleotide adenylyltransferase
MNPARRLGILGGMFDPIHQGHLDTGAAAQRALNLLELLVVPANIPPHRPQPIASSHHRFAMVAMAVAGRAGWRAVDLELTQPTRSFTADTLRRLHMVGFVPTELFFIAGADAFLEIATWKDYPAVLDLAHFSVVERPGVKVSELPERLPALASRMRLVDAAAPRRTGTAAHEQTMIFLIDAATADVSSTAIRQARQQHQSIAGMVPPSVEQHIEQHDLYDAPPPAAGDGGGWVGAQAGRLHGQN